jgi:hypothetical protein
VKTADGSEQWSDLWYTNNFVREQRDRAMIDLGNWKLSQERWFLYSAVGDFVPVKASDFNKFH